MNSLGLGELLTETLTTVLQEAIYALVDRSEPIGSDDTHVVESLVAFTGTYTGTIALEVEESGATEVAGSFVGDEVPEDQGASNRDAIGELANIVTGCLLEAWLARNINYDIGIPKVTSTTHGQTRLATEPQVCMTTLRTDGGFRVSAAVLLGVWS